MDKEHAGRRQKEGSTCVARSVLLYLPTMTSYAFDRRKMVRFMFNTLEGERYVRAPLLREVIDVAADDPELEAARGAATALLRAIDEGIDDREFDRRVQQIAATLAS